MEHDPELQHLIRQWRPPATPSTLDAGMLARYRTRRPPWWRRRLEVRLTIPVTALAAAMLLMLASGAWFVHRNRQTAEFRMRMGGFEPVSAPSLTIVAEVER